MMPYAKAKEKAPVINVTQPVHMTFMYESDTLLQAKWYNASYPMLNQWEKQIDAIQMAIRNDPNSDKMNNVVRFL